MSWGRLAPRSAAALSANGSSLGLVFGLLVGLGALILRMTDLSFGKPEGSMAPVKASYVPIYAHLALVLAAGIYLPPPIVSWFQHVASQLG